ncbi:MAG: Gfo/Idh/MocA family oxidoreductase [Terrimicrobiaceae bacterium]
MSARSVKIPASRKGSIRLGVVGVGNMGRAHATSIHEGRVPGGQLAAVCDVDPKCTEGFGEAARFEDARSLFESGAVDAVVIAAPHPFHASLGKAAFRAGLEVLMEKPLAVHKAEAQDLIAASKGRIFAAMFNQRTDPCFQKVRSLVQDGELGTLRRFTWTITDWFRTHAYYRSSPWRASWKGEGGGVLINQAVHNMDLLQWIFGMPSKVRAMCGFGKFHPIEVEDEVTALLEYDAGASGVFITSSGEAPGINRLEIAGDHGLLILDGESLQFRKNEIPTPEFSRTCQSGYERPPVWNIEIPLPGGRGPQHEGILRNFVNAMLHGEALIAPGAEGLYSLELTNAILMASLEDRTVSLPLSASHYSRLLKNLQSQTP